jgi:hypothetical protein
MLISRALHRSIAVSNSPVTFRFRRLFWPKLAQTFTALTVCSIDTRQVRVRVARNKCARCPSLPVLNVLTRNARPNNFSQARALLGKSSFVRSKCCDDQGDIATVLKGGIGGVGLRRPAAESPRSFGENDAHWHQHQGQRHSCWSLTFCLHIITIASRTAYAMMSRQARPRKIWPQAF